MRILADIVADTYCLDFIFVNIYCKFASFAQFKTKGKLKNSQVTNRAYHYDYQLLMRVVYLFSARTFRY